MDSEPRVPLMITDINNITLWYFNIATENTPFLVDLLIQNGDFTKVYESLQYI